ncbi:MAG: flagellar filament capping protein FliD [Bryobacteraceae bacterium]
MSLTPLTFTGISIYSSDFQSIMDRAVSIATIPIKALQNQQTDLVQKKMLVGNLSTAADKLASSLKSLGSLASKKSLVASSSDTSKVTATNSGASSTATYTITDIKSLAKVASETSVLSYPDASSTAVATTPATIKLTVGSTSKTLDISQNNTLAGLRDAINNSGLDVTATILTVSDTESYLSVSANNPGAKTLSLVDNPDGTTPVDLIKHLNQGSDTVFTMNGALVKRASTQVSDLIPGVVLNFSGTTALGESVDVSLGTDRTGISNALQDLVTNYNAVASLVNAQIGENAGLLSGDSLVRQAQSSLRQLANYTGSGGIATLADLGIEFDSTGKASFKQGTFDALPDSNLNDVFSFLGSASAGLGGISSIFTQISDPITGLAKLQQDQYTATDTRLSDQIAKQTDQVNLMQAGLAAKLIAADSLLAQMESQQKVIDASIQSLNLVLYGKSTQN